MKKSTTKIKVLITWAVILLPLASTLAQTRYLDNVFPSVTVTPDVIYGNNISIITGAPAHEDLFMDVYEPTGDACTLRPLVIYLHAGTYLPILYNNACVGMKTDSSVVEICKQFARKGYVAVAMDYRLGWRADAIGSDPDLVTGTIFQAAYRGILDAKACVRFFKANASAYGVDTTKIAIGGVGAGAIIALNYVSLQDTLQLWLEKFKSTSNNPSAGFVAGMPYINIHTLGDFEGYGGIPQLNNPNNSPGHTSTIQMVFSIYGEIGDSSSTLGDSSWIRSNFVPTAALHPKTPPVGGGPYHWGTVYAGNTGVPVLPDVSGPHQYIKKFNDMGVNNVFTSAGFSDAYTMRANSVNDGIEGVFPFVTSTPQEDLWDWFDSTAMCILAPFIGLTCQDGKNAYHASLVNNPNMSKTQALAYIDTIQNYLAPRFVKALNPGIANCTTVGIHEPTASGEDVLIYPNPASDHVYIALKNQASQIRKIEMTDLSGRLVLSTGTIKTSSYNLSRNNLESGMYFVKLNLDTGEVVEKITLQ